MSTAIQQQIQAILSQLTPAQMAKVSGLVDLSKINIMTLSETEARNLLAKIRYAASSAMSNPIAEGLRDSADKDRENALLARDKEDACRQHCEALRKKLPDKDSPDYKKAEEALRMAEIDLECASMDREYRVRRANHTELCADIATRRAGNGFNILG